MSTLKLLGDSSGYVQLVANVAAANNTLTLPNVNDTLANVTSPTFLSTNAGVAMVIDANGNMGIGTTSPAFKLDVSGTIRASSDTGIQLRNSANQFIGALITPFGWGVSSGSTTDISVAAANNLTFFSGNNVTERMRISSSGQVGIATSSPAYTLDVYDTQGNPINTVSTANGGGNMRMVCNNPQTSVIGYIGPNAFGNNVFAMGTSLSTPTIPLTFYTSGSERMRIDSGGNVMIGTTNNLGTGLSGALIGSVTNLGAATRQPSPIVWGKYSTSAGLPQLTFNWASSNYWGIGPNTGSNDSGLRIGIVAFDANGAYWTGSYPALFSGAYTNASDYRLKENVRDITDSALDKILALRPVTYNLKHTADPDPDIGAPVIRREIGFIAHEVQAQIPELVTGIKDEVNDDGTPQHQGIDYAKMTAVLVKAMQELTAKVAALEAKVGNP